MVVHSCCPSTLEMEAGGRTRSLRPPWLQSKFEVSLDLVLITTNGIGCLAQLPSNPEVLGSTPRIIKTHCGGQAYNLRILEAERGGCEVRGHR